MWNDEFEQIIRRYLVLPAEQPLPADAQLAGLGLDSLGTVSVLMDLEEAFSVTFTDEQLVPETFATATALWGALSELPVAAG
ncbi:hypothetical protein GCM10010172_65760 [Paractinoplanes ferrugineus]|uniref:Carrier domain-containing protein n=1 Tax=Paractinoplanes ferrugineus TaxID=113564 RepID=A0A919MEZ1_9ACTN|nr:phosphopantetheine-binding protein [Actinoplanes ferrugineus]GIE13263.1 hypothetical protein Afe05nite_51030 [Actinoplanes ferrugineus]